MRHRRHSRFYRSSRALDREGVAAVEFAITFPIILIIFLGTIELANLNYLRNLTNDAAFQVARKMIVPGAEQQDAIAESEQLLGQLRISGAEFHIQEGADKVYVQVSVPIARNSWGIGRLVNNIMLRQDCTLRKSLDLNN